MDPSFRVGKIPVRIQPAFFVMALVLGASEGGLAQLVAWVAIVFVSVMFHELGHAAAGLAFGLEPRIDLHTMGGTTSWSTQRPLSAAQRVAISLAGPFAGFLLGGVVWAIGPRGFPHLAGDFVYDRLLFVNVVWGALNLLPMLPLDGGNAMVQLLNAVTSGRGERPAYIVSMAVAGLAIPIALLFQSYWCAMLALLFAGSNWRGLQEWKARQQDSEGQARRATEPGTAEK
jgi:Zn-dependent protease